MWKQTILQIDRQEDRKKHKEKGKICYTPEVLTFRVAHSLQFNCNDIKKTKRRITNCLVMLSIIVEHFAHCIASESATTATTPTQSYRILNQ